ncbi:MAG: RecQ family ATP-dependent DNA helicase [Leptospirales bacterium]|nr:RecQ family ATP-dependent DNA helicase [Leptospirales bacterium]
MGLDTKEIIFIDVEIDPKNSKILDIGAITGNGLEFHKNSLTDFANFLRGSKYVCGHNILNHDLRYIKKEVAASSAKHFVDTLYLSPLMFPKKPYHHLVKDDKLTVDELNNPLNDAKKARDLFYDEAATFKNLEKRLQRIYFGLLSNSNEFKDFFHYIGFEDVEQNISALVRETFAGKICENAPIERITEKHPAALAYALSQVNVIKYDSVTPPWVLKSYPRVENILHFLRSRNCSSCSYCDESLDETKALKKFFNYDNFRSYDGMPLQKDAAKAAVDGKSILAVFPTGGGKSITFQLPALMAGANEKGLTIVISPLQSLMKDQTDNLEYQHNITDAVTINSSLDPLERAKAFERVEDGSASILYISPESLRSKSIERLLLKRNVVRFVIDEAHCFSSWGHDFRVDYLYIGDFIRSLQKKKYMLQNQNIPVSCFTATAKQKVIADIRDYFKDKLSLELEVFRASSARINLRYHIFNEENDSEKYLKLRQLIIDSDCPTIVYVSRTRRTVELATKLTDDGYPAKPYHGQMDKQIRVANQDAFMQGEVNIIVATTAFGMGVDKRDVGMVIHYDISDSLENYVQEAGRAGRDEKIQADCFVLFNDEDLNKHFNMLNQTKVSQKEIQQVWRALKDLTKTRLLLSQSALEIARQSGWDDSVHDIETRVKTSINALEQSDFVKRGQNMPRIFADSILVKNMEEARTRIDKSALFDDKSRQQAIRIISNLISARSKTRGKDEDGESRVDYISDRLGIVKEDVIRVIQLLREEKILADAKDLVAYIKKGDGVNRSKTILSAHMNIENFLFEHLDDAEKTYNIKEMNEKLQTKFSDVSINQLNTVLNYFAIKRLIKRTKEYSKNHITLKPYFNMAEIQSKSGKRYEIAGVIIDYLYSKVSKGSNAHNREDAVIGFSVLELKDEFSHNLLGKKAKADEIEDALYYLLKIGAIKIEGGFLVIYNAMLIERLEKNNRAQYKKEHYSQLYEYYQNKRQQIHIVGEYANRMVNDYNEAMTFVDDYFVMNYDMFLHKYFKGRKDDINKNITPKKFRQLFGELSPAQLNIIKDQDSDCIVVAAGPGSGKTKLLTHKLASLYMMEDVKHEQMLMLTFSRAAATEFKKRLMTLIGNAANFIQIMTFHSYCFDLLGRVGDLEKSDKIIKQTVEKIKAGEVDLTRLTKTVLVIDEAQDMSKAEYSLVKMLMEENDNLRIIAVGDDDQNIYEFRGSSSEHFKSLLKEPNAKKYELIDNYRSNSNIVEFANIFAETISQRFKTIPIMPKKKENGIINICKLRSDNIAIPAVNAVLDIKPSGSICVVTRTNEEALNIVGLLIKNDIAAKQIQTNNDFSLYNLVELRDFIDYIDTSDDGYVIIDDVWQGAKSNLKKKYEGSNNLPGGLKLIDDFEEINNKTKYKSDLKQFVRESKLENFISDSEGSVLVSTIHQTKGREFDNVFLALSRFPKMDDETKRAVYVAITRAKQNLYILYNDNYFDKIAVENIQRISDNSNYPVPEQINLQLSHRDVALGYFTSRRKEIDSLVSGKELSIRDRFCCYGDKQVLKFSSKFCTQIEELKAKGYSPTKATIRHIVFWQDKEKEIEIKIILPDIEFVRNKI